LNKEIFKVLKSEIFSNDFGLVDKIRRESVSIVSNIAEGFKRNGSKVSK